MKIKTIDITAYEWFDRVNGNSYFAATVTLNFGLSDALTIKIPYQYGYGDQYKYQCFHELVKQEVIKDRENSLQPLWRYCQDKGIILRTTKIENCKKRELTNL